MIAGRSSSRRLLSRCLWLPALAVACVHTRPAPVRPSDIPRLEAQARENPRKADAQFRLAAAYLAAGRCDDAARQARAGLQIEADNVLGPLVLGACQERQQRYDLAVQTYTGFTERHPRTRGVAAVRAKSVAAVRAGATLAARQAVQRESALTTLPPEPSTLAVLPVTIAGDTAFGSLSRGLAELITTDLAMLRSIRMLERMHVGALLDELRLAQTGRVDPATASRMGRLLRAERLVQGVAGITSERQPVRLHLTLVAGDGTVLAGPEVSGRFRDLLELEKQVVLGLGPVLGIQITEAERRRILGQGPKNLAAFLAYSRGLEALDHGDYGAAARHFGEAVRADPSFSAAAQAGQAAQAAPAVEGLGAEADLTGVVDAVEDREAAAGITEPTRGDVLAPVTNDVTPTLGDAIRPLVETGIESTTRQVLPETRGLTNLQGTSTIIRIIFRRPL